MEKLIYEQPCPSCRVSAGWFIEGTMKVVTLYGPDGEVDDVRQKTETLRESKKAVCRGDGCTQTLPAYDVQEEEEEDVA